MSSYTLKKIDIHQSGKWSLYELLPANASEILKTSSTENEEQYRRLNKTRFESRRHAKVVLETSITPITEKTTGDLSF